MINNIQIQPSKKAVIYCRVSTKEQVDEGNSLVSQQRICREYAAKQGYEVVEAFIEKGESAKTADRTELKRLMAFCTSKKDTAQAVIAYKVDRISRNIADYSYIRVRLKKYGVEIKSVTEVFDDTPAGRFMENIIANVGQFDNDVRTERCIGGMREAVQEGRYVWQAPLGYDNVRYNGKSTIAPNDMAPMMKEVFERIAQRIDSSDAIRVFMNQKGLRGRNGEPVGQANFFRLIRNPLYKGMIYKLGIVKKGLFDPIVSEELFDEVQAILTGRKNKVKTYLHENPDFPLRRFVVNETGKQLTGYWSQGKRLKYPYYSFQTPGTTVRKEVLEKKFMEFLATFELDDSQLNTIKHYLKRFFDKKFTALAGERELIEKRVIEINAQIDKLIEMHGNGGISVTILSERTKNFEKELENLNELLKNRPEKEFNLTEILALAADVLKRPQILWQKSPFHIKKKLQVFDFPEGVVFDGTKFRTPKMWSIFKLKSEFQHGFMSIVNYQHGENNTQSTENLPPYGNSLNNTKAYWEMIVTDLVTLSDILSQNGEDIRK